MAVNDIREKLIAEIKRLPEDELAEVFDFVQFLHQKHRRVPAHSTDEDAKEDLILNRFVGGVSDGSLANRIDEELYGS